MKRGKKRSKRWSHTEGARGYTVTVQERTPGGVIYARAFDPKLRGGHGGYRFKSLGHNDREKARKYALKQACDLREGLSAMREEKVTLARVFNLYKKYRTPQKAMTTQQADERRIEMWTKVLGPSKNPAFISRDEEWQTFINRRQSGEIDARGNVVAPDKRVQVRNRAIEADCIWLRSVLSWAVTYQSAAGERLLKTNATDGLEIPTELNPKRPIASRDRYEATRAVSDRVLMEVRWNGKRLKQRSYLSEMLDISTFTARRISAVCGLRFEDVNLAVSEDAPYGVIRWPEETDKEGMEWITPISPEARAALERIMAERPGIGRSFLFPHGSKPGHPITRHLAASWILSAEKLAGLHKLDGGLWHPLRRKWATEKKTMPIADVARAGGWRSKKTIEDCYQQADGKTMLSVVLGGFELRERRG